ncbi:alpha/beta hydrolase [Catellatospora chokoriensis]|nr:alpha/beta hydrolase [Catellatospora chokoriensis]
MTIPTGATSVVFSSADCHVELAGTFTEPQVNGPFPLAVMVPGSGALDRDATSFGHQPFARLATELCDLGVATLRYDKRGTGLSGGDLATAGIDDHVSDVMAAVDHVWSRRGPIGGPVGIIGHSEGAANATYAAALGAQVDFLVLLAGAGVSGMDLLMEQHRRLSTAAGLSDEACEEARELQDHVLRTVRDIDDYIRRAQLLKELLAPMTDGHELNTEIEQLASPWFQDFVRRDPTTALVQVACPVLAIWGDLDVQVPPELHVPAIRAVAPGSTVEVWPGVNHLFQQATTGLPDEYARLPEGMAGVAARVSSWLGQIGLLRRSTG